MFGDLQMTPGWGPPKHGPGTNAGNGAETGHRPREALKYMLYTHGLISFSPNAGR